MQLQYSSAITGYIYIPLLASNRVAMQQTNRIHRASDGNFGIRFRSIHSNTLKAVTEYAAAGAWAGSSCRYIAGELLQGGTVS